MNMDLLRARAYEALRSRWGNQLPPVRIARGVLSFVNDMVGRPLAPEDEIQERRAYEERRRARIAQQRLAAAQAAEAAAAPPVAAAEPARSRSDAAPVIVYVDAQSHRDAKRIADVFRGRDIPFTELSVVEDVATRSWVESTARTRELPVVFVAGKPVGGYDALVQLDVKGELVRMVWGLNAG
jgi:glutaredoxin-related protein